MSQGCQYSSHSSFNSVCDKELQNPRHFFSELASVAFNETIMFIASSSEKDVPLFELNSISQFMLSKQKSKNSKKTKGDNSICDCHSGSVFRNHLTNCSNCFPLMPESGSNDLQNSSKVATFYFWILCSCSYFASSQKFVFPQ